METSANADSAGRTRLDSLGSSAGPTPSCATAPSIISMLASGSYVDSGDRVAFLGDGTGESHLLIGRQDPFCLDELGNVQLDVRGAERCS